MNFAIGWPAIASHSTSKKLSISHLGSPVEGSLLAKDKREISCYDRRSNMAARDKHDSLVTGPTGFVFLLLLISPNGLSQTSSSAAAEIRDYMSQGQAALRANQPNVAARAYQSILRLDPKNIEARANLGVVAMSTGDWSEAAEDLDAALKLQPSQSRVQALLGLCEIRLGKPAEARKLLSAAFPKLEDPKLKREAGLQLLSIQFETGELDKASAILTALQELYPGDAAISYAAFRVYSDLAFQAIESLAVNAPDSAQLHRALAEHLVNDGRNEAAVTEFRKALAISPDAPDLHFELGQALLFQSRVESSLEEAQKEFRSSLSFNPADARCECKLAEIELLRSNSAEAANHFAQALRLDSEAGCAKAGLAEQLMDEGKEQQALDYLQAAVRGDPYNDQFHYRLSACYRRMGNKGESAKEMEKVKELRELKDELQQALHSRSSPE
jgi:tetratricopeptide (TPR) repeat protein